MKQIVKILCFGIAMISLFGCTKNNQQANSQSYVEVIDKAGKDITPDNEQ